MENDFLDSCTYLARKIVTGGAIELPDLFTLNQYAEFDKIDPMILPDERTTTGKIAARRERIFCVTKMLWGLDPEQWQQLENDFVKENGGLSDPEEKDLEDLVIPKLLCRIIATSIYVSKNLKDKVRCDAAINQLNSYIFEICTKGLTFSTFVDEKPLLPELVHAGIVLTGDKYLPSPEKSLFKVFSLLKRGTIRPEVYVK